MSSVDDNFSDHDFQDEDDGRYPLHDCCEYESVEALMDLIYLEDSANDDSSTDDNDSTAAAHAAAIGHSPRTFRTSITEPGPKLPAELAQPPIGSARGKDDNDTKPMDVDGSVKDADNVERAVGETKGTSEEKPATEEAGAKPMDTDKPAGSIAVGADSKNDSNGDYAVNVLPKPEPKAPKAKKRVVNPSILINGRDEDENVPLHVAIHSRKLEHAKILLDAGASFRFKSDGSFPMHTAISIGAISAHRQFAYECVELLHEHGADLTVKDESSHTPLFLACMYNLPQIASYIVMDEQGLSTLNVRADRAGNRPLHAAAKYDTLENPSFSKPDPSLAASKTASSGSESETVPKPTGSIDSPGRAAPSGDVAASGMLSTEAMLTKVLLGASGIEVDAVNVVGQTPLHVACLKGNWTVARLLLQAGASPSAKDRRGLTPGQLAYKRAMPIPNDLSSVLGEPPETGVVPPIRELIVDPDKSTLLLTHELCVLHRTCPPIRRDSAEPPPENVRRLEVLVDPITGILRSGEFSGLIWRDQCRRAAISDVLKVHDYTYVEKLTSITSSIPDHPSALAHLDGDTAISRWSFEAALRAAGSVCEAVDQLLTGEKVRNVFCAVRPPGHHAGPRGIVRCANDPEGGSHGFCLLNNVCIGAAYARSVYRNEGIKKIAILDFDVHHGNGTEEVIRNLVPMVEKETIRIPFAFGEMSTSTYRPWLDETDIDNVFFASAHGYGNRGYDQPGWFYPASGKTYTSEAITRPSMVEKPPLEEFILSQTWARMGENSKSNCCKIINVGLELPDNDVDPQFRSMKQRLEVRDTYRKTILPALRDFDPDLIFISAGFDAHRRDTMNFGYVGMVEDDYEWLTEQIIKIANTCCEGRVISVLEGGYKIHGGIVSPFARSVASHVRALVDGGRSRAQHDPDDLEWEAQFERHLYERRERKKEQEREQLRLMQEENRRMMLEQLSGGRGDAPEDPDAPSRKRRRNQVDYKELFRKMQEEGFAS